MAQRSVIGDENHIGARTKEIFLDPHSELFPIADSAMEAARLVESYHRLQLIYDLGIAICKETDLDRALIVIKKEIIRLIRLERCLIAILDEGGKFRPLIQHNLSLPENPEDWPIRLSRNPQRQATGQGDGGAGVKRRAVGITAEGTAPRS